MDTTTSSANAASSRAESSARSSQRSAAAQGKEKKPAPAPEPKPADYGVTVKGRFDPDLRRFFVTILDASSQTVITQFPSQTVARYVQQLKKAASDSEAAQKNADSADTQDSDKLDQST